MGQYYYVVNLDKKQYLHPHKFGDGLKLLEFGCSGEGTMTGLAILLADGNGRGGGDLCQTGGVGYKDDTWRTKLDNEPKPNHKRDCEWEFEGKKYATDVHEIVGSWAGDRIVIAGDYADGKKFIEDAPKEKLEKIAKECFTEGHQKVEEVNLHHYAQYEFEDISERVLEAMKDNPCIKKSLEENENRFLRPDMVVTAKQ